jgi:hypothetical protein
MTGDGLAHVAAETADEVCARFALEAEANALPRAEMSPRHFLSRLIEERQFVDAARFLAHALPKREAVWWACLCARKVAGPDSPAAHAAAIEGAELWATDPTEANRRAAMPLAETTGMGTPAGCAAAAAFWSGGSLATPELPAVPPPDHLTAHGVASAVMLAAVNNEPEKAHEKFRAFFELGLGVAEGRLRWSAQPSPASRKAAEPAAPGQPAAPSTRRPAINWD